MPLILYADDVFADLLRLAAALRCSPGQILGAPRDPDAALAARLLVPAPLSFGAPPMLATASPGHRGRTVQVTVNRMDLGELKGLGLVAAAGGVAGAGVKFWKWLVHRRDSQNSEATAATINFQGRILDDADDLRHELAEEARRCRESERLAIERAHAAELRVATLTAELYAARLAAAVLAPPPPSNGGAS